MMIPKHTKNRLFLWKASMMTSMTLLVRGDIVGTWVTLALLL